MPSKLLRLLVLFILSFAATPAQADIVIASNSVCTYFKGTNEASSPISAWRTRDFDDSSWLRGTNAIYYGTTATSSPLTGNTLLTDMRSNYSCVFIRQTFVITNLSQVTNLNLVPIYKDGFVVWLNGVEVKRSSSFTNAVPYYTNYARNAVSAPLGLATNNLALTNYTLLLGTNILAIQGFIAPLSNAASKGFYFNTELNGGFKDTTSPWLQSTVPPAGSTVTNLTQINVVFSEAVTNVTPGSLQINGANALMVSGTGSNYTFSFRVPSAGLASVSLNPTNQIMDLSSNLLMASSPWQYTWVVIPPVVTALDLPAGSMLTNFTQLNVTFSVAVANVMAEDLVINGNGATTVSGSGSNYTFTFDQPAFGPVTVYWDPLNEITDLAGIPLSTGLPWNYTLQPPAIMATANPAAGATVNRLTQVAVTFNLPVTGVVASVLLVNGQAATNVSGSGSGPYLFKFPQPTPGQVQFSWAANQHIRQAAAFTNLFVGQSWTVTFDPTLVFADVVINEFLAANISVGGLTDEDGDLSSWIELYNRGPDSANLTGWSLSNDPNNP
ncbi:MAG: hypothetical protein NTW03_12960, partial [Verrucomicrobia bacterium]|nr:hypothetical protein [Verrucomicrobiota bacterium]